MRLLALIAIIIAALIVIPAGAAVGNLYATQTCTGSGLSLGFTWYGVSPQAREVWLDLSQRSNTFAPGTFSSFGPIDPGRNFYHATTASSVRVYARVNQLLSDGRWDPSPVYYIDLISCQSSQPSYNTPQNPPE